MLLAFSDRFSQCPRFYLFESQSFLGGLLLRTRSHIVRVEAFRLACFLSFAIFNAELVSTHLTNAVASVEFALAVVRAAYAIIIQLVAASSAAVVEITVLLVHATTISSAQAILLISVVICVVILSKRSRSIYFLFLIIKVRFIF